MDKIVPYTDRPSFAGFATQNDHNLRATQIDHLSAKAPLDPSLRALIPDDVDLPPSSTSVAPSADPLPPGHVAFTSYPFVEFRGVGILPREDLAFLASKACLSVPDKTVIDDFVRQYFLHIHPSMPVLDEAAFWDMYLHPGEDVDGRVSLFVFQALLFVSCAHVPLETLQQCGFKDKRDARNSFYRRTKYLFDLSGEDRPYAKSQGCIILSHHTSGEEPQAASLWLTRAIQNAMTIGCKPGPSEDVEDSLKKRLWWSIILRDRSLCLGLRRRGQVTSLEFGMAAEPLDEEDFADEIRRSQVYEPDTKRMLVKVLQEQCRLSVLLTEMVSFVFASHGLAAPVMGFEQFHHELARIARIQRLLAQWEACSQLQGLLTGVPDPVTQMTNFAYMFYHTARIDLAHYETLLIENHLLLAGTNYIHHLWQIGATLYDAMNQLTAVMEYFSREGRAQNLPLSVLAYVAMPLVLTAIDLKLSPTSSELDTRRRRLDALGAIIRHSGRVYDVTDMVSAGTNHILQLAYMTSQHLFLRWDDEPPTPRVRSGQSNRGATHLVEKDALPTPPPFPSARRAASWHEAFLRHPRAYLLISTSVDYSLSVGRLPYDSALPELVRCIPPIGIGIRLPWTMPSPSTPISPRRAKQKRQLALRERIHSISSSASSIPVDGYRQMETDNSPVGTDTLRTISDEAEDAPSRLILGLSQQQQGNDDTVNLDYLYLDNMCDPTSLDHGLECDETHFGGSAQPMHQQQQQQQHQEPNYSPNEQSQCDQTVAGFDPLISSIVQEFFGEQGGPGMAIG
ncbi:hypothetical protein P168DRAFT_337206 [Aspergillus campestris IBT 28561]|uniref:Xylanolytic transcriptional activator regulatory domain-containing protein n=1 Tax=Aspergillus campestris (strain IBT 28561) TaxID=1392248 RepID=A0A2I1CQZ1_ASPC2|nr:uncharacterized protein P168DRAFT_337206 [Aspergillus campestris IBT 28561]PKY00035.1 hypothetical protein P168DRAFT_337206 [Aspergillus campestris IBT 28561]